MSRRLLLIVLLAALATGSGRASAPAVDAVRVRALIDAGKYLDAETVCQQAIVAIEKEQGPDALEIADALDLVIESRWQSRRMSSTAQESRAMAERALKIKEALLPPDDPRVAMTLVNVGVARTSARDTANARVAFERAVSIFERTRPDSLELARALATLAWSHWQGRRLTVAAEMGERALALTRKVEQPPGRETSAALSTLGGIARNQKDFEKSLLLFEQALAIDEQINGVDHPANAYTLIGLSGAAGDAGDLQRSRDTQEQAIRIIEKIPGSERRLAFELLAHASKLEHYGDYAAALRFAERGLAIAERTAPPGSALQTAALDEMASLQDLLGEHAAAAALRAKTLSLWSGIQADSVHMATALNALANSYEEAGQLDEAFEAIERGLKLKALEGSEGEHARLLLTYGHLLAKRGRYDDARTALERALELEKAATNDAQPADAGVIRVQLARIERQDDHLPRALTLYRDAVEESTRQLGSTHIRTAEQRLELASALAEHGDIGEARGLMVQGEDASIEHLRLVTRTLPERRALAFAAERTSGVDLAVTLALAGSATNIDAAWQLVIRSRTVVLDEMAARQRAVIAESNQASVRDQWIALNRARARLATLIVNGPEGLGADEYQAAVEQTRTACDRAEQALALASTSFRQEQQRTHAGVKDVLARLPHGAVLVSYVRYTPQRVGTTTAHAGAAATTAARAGTMPAAAARAGATPAAADAARRPAAYAAFVARAGQPVRVVALGPADAIDAAIAAWREQIQSELRSAGLAAGRGEAAYRAAGRQVRMKLWDPLRASLGTASASAGAAASGPVFIVPDAAIHLVDFSTLPTASTGYLVDAPIAIHYLLAERDLVEPQAEPHGNSLLALGAPDFDRIDRTAVTRLTAEASSATHTDDIGSGSGGNSANGRSGSASISAKGSGGSSRSSGIRGGTRSACEAFAERKFTPLPATREETQHIAKLWHLGADGQHRVQILVDDQATEAAFKAMAPGRRVLHLATHGFFLDRTCSMSPTTAEATNGARTAPTRGAQWLEENPLLRSGLVLAGANQRAQAGADDEDGILTAEEIAGLNLSETEWAVLSACDTGRGDWQPSEGVLGLRRAFEVAGARTVILSLWPVIDTVASQWMTALYREKFLHRAQTATAVRSASRKLLAARRGAGQSTHPLYWSGFIATGDWR